jgi:anti-sigma-K factor RskA
VNLNKYIESGILEAYLLDEVTPTERAEVEQMLARHPELRQELARVEETLESMLMKSAVEPRKEVKEKLMTKITATDKAAKVVPVESTLSAWKLAAAALVVLFIGATAFAVYYRQQWVSATVALSDLIAQNQQIANDYSTVNQKLDKIQQDLAVLENPGYSRIILKGTPNAPEALASVYWNSASEEVFLSIQNLRILASEKQYQLWAIVDGKPVDAGVFDGGLTGLVKMKPVRGAEAFAVTIEPRGGKPSPSLETMQVMGQVKTG